MTAKSHPFIAQRGGLAPESKPASARQYVDINRYDRPLNRRQGEQPTEEMAMRAQAYVARSLRQRFNWARSRRSALQAQQLNLIRPP
jgi:hypothetical protein